MPHKVEFTEHFTDVFEKLSDEEQSLIEEFVFHFEEHGLKTFHGKKGPTDNVPPGDPDRAKKIAYAKKQRLWHVHIGHPKWNHSRNPTAGYKTSNYVVHFQKFNETYIALVDYSSHNPMLQPPRHRLFKQY